MRNLGREAELVCPVCGVDGGVNDIVFMITDKLIRIGYRWGPETGATWEDPGEHNLLFTNQRSMRLRCYDKLPNAHEIDSI